MFSVLCKFHGAINCFRTGINNLQLAMYRLVALPLIKFKCLLIADLYLTHWGLVNQVEKNVTVYADTLYIKTTCLHVCHWTGSSLVEVMAWHLFGAKPLPEPMMTYCQLDPNQETCCLVPSHYLNQWWLIVNWTLSKKLQCNWNQNVLQESSF